MPTYTKPSVLPAWCESHTTTADMIQPPNGDIQLGWVISAIPFTRQRLNWLFNFLANAVRYFMQRGISDYDATETYGLNSVVIGDDGLTYKSLGAGNIGHTPSTSPVQWVRWGFTLAQIRIGINVLIVVPFSATPNFDCSLSSSFEIVLTGNIAPTFTNIIPGQFIRLALVQDSTGNRTVTWPASNVVGASDIDGTGSATNVITLFARSNSKLYAAAADTSS